MNFEPILSAARIDAMRKDNLWPDKLLIDILDQIVIEEPDSLAIVSTNSETEQETRLTYRELRERSDAIAAAFVALGVQRDDVIAVQLPNWWHYAAVYCACVRIGAVINPLMPIFRTHELTFMLGHAEAKVLIVPQSFRGFDYLDMAMSLRDSLPHLEHVLVVDGIDTATNFDRVVEAQQQSGADLTTIAQQRRPDPNDVTELMYTSGTTGEPKGVMHSANTLLCKGQLASELFEFQPGDVIFMGSPLAHQTGFMYACVLSIFQGAKCVLQDVWDATEAARLVERERCTITLGSTPFLSDLVSSESVGDYDLSSLRVFLCAGAPIPGVLVENALQKFPNLTVLSAWGMTEMGIATATYLSDPGNRAIETDGRALPHQAVRIVDEAGRVLGPGTEGRLQSRGATTFIGYLKRPDAYEMHDDFWFETGDNARMDEAGYIRITGRSKDIIIRGGENIPIVEVEELLYRHPAVLDAAIVAMPDDRLGERGCAFVTLQNNTDFEFGEMVTYLSAAGLTRQYLPEHLEIIPEFPRTPSGKIQKFKLREMAKELTPVSTSSKRGGE